MSDPATYMPLVNTPMVGEACQKFAHIFRQARGMYLLISARGRIREILGNWGNGLFPQSHQGRIAPKEGAMPKAGGARVRYQPICLPDVVRFFSVEPSTGSGCRNSIPRWLAPRSYPHRSHTAPQRCQSLGAG
jgi:hypothetical protein